MNPQSTRKRRLRLLEVTEQIFTLKRHFMGLLHGLLQHRKNHSKHQNKAEDINLVIDTFLEWAAIKKANSIENVLIDNNNTSISAHFVLY